MKNSRVQVTNCIINDKCSDNISDHQPIQAQIQIELIPDLSSIIKDETSTIVSKSAWKNPEFQTNYKAEIEHNLEQNSSAIESCTDTIEKILLVQDIMSASSLSAFYTTYRNKSAPAFHKEWWTPQLTASKRILATHFNAWRDHGFPKEADDVFFNRYRLARKNFRCAVKAAQNKMIAEKHTKINSLKRTDPRKFWTNMRRMKETDQKRSFNINDKQTEEEITREFGDHFNTLLNNPKGKAVPETRGLPEHSEEPFITCPEEVKEAIEKLKEYKSTDYFGLAAEHFIHASSEVLPSHIFSIYNSIFEEKIAPTPLGCSTLISLQEIIKICK